MRSLNSRNFLFNYKTILSCWVDYYFCQRKYLLPSPRIFHDLSSCLGVVYLLTTKYVVHLLQRSVGNQRISTFLPMFFPLFLLAFKPNPSLLLNPAISRVIPDPFPPPRHPPSARSSDFILLLLFQPAYGNRDLFFKRRGEGRAGKDAQFSLEQSTSV